MKRMMMATNEERGPLVGVGLQQHPQRRPLLIRLFFFFLFLPQVVRSGSRRFRCRKAYDAWDTLHSSAQNTQSSKL